MGKDKIIGAPEFLRYYKIAAKNPVDEKRFRAISGAFNRYLMDRVLDGDSITLPSKLGPISLQSFKPTIKIEDDGSIKGLAPDWVKTKALWDRNPTAKENKKLVYHANEHTDGERIKYRWQKMLVNVANKKYYTFKASRNNKRLASAKIKEGCQYRR